MVEVCLGVFVLLRMLRSFVSIRCSAMPELFGTSEYCGSLEMNGLGKWTLVLTNIGWHSVSENVSVLTSYARSSDCAQDVEGTLSCSRFMGVLSGRSMHLKSVLESSFVDVRGLVVSLRLSR